MSELVLAQEQCLALRAQAHRLQAVVLLGAAGLSEAALREIGRALDAHGLVKVRGGRLEREQREALFRQMAERLGAARVQLIGHTFVLYRPPVEKSKAAPRPAPPKPAAARRRAGPPAAPARPRSRPARQR